MSKLREVEKINHLPGNAMTNIFILATISDFRFPGKPEPK